MKMINKIFFFKLYNKVTNNIFQYFILEYK